jgi:hypothetical protein
MRLREGESLTITRAEVMRCGLLALRDVLLGMAAIAGLIVLWGWKP